MWVFPPAALLAGFLIPGNFTRQKIYLKMGLFSRAGVFAIVLECLPSALGTLIDEKLSIPTIGVGAAQPALCCRRPSVCNFCVREGKFPCQGNASN
ncbi:3-methyl-2-oxobutanoate hydroxymethyltransferase [Acetomicrobium sp.]|uniref:3-methyl-2-oxobutanoate hydroxymethyltransferase n=1 Tax=Acetomicrobium sp. TaxID=1872099 RepID=UPI0028727D16|nr:3-methyl-2-oxobutanoate hydroxymethyltransferase [Acetomicrobium sp.]MDR9769395.1 3-methyl-2-oxobutanoate hydroxymethyltransferase [Acetomicrobium sp.]